MRINRFIAVASGLSRRAADQAIADSRVLVNGQPPSMGQDVTATDHVTLDNQPLRATSPTQTILLNKPVGYVVSRNGQGSKTIYDLLPPELHNLKPIGRLDKDSSGLLLLTNDGQLAQQLTHPRFQKRKVYEITLDKPLQPLHRQMISEFGIDLADGKSKLALERLHEGNEHAWRVIMHEGRNRQIRRTFAALGYAVTTLNRTIFSKYELAAVPLGGYQVV
ncbi:MAG TPA: pseudouridine synthase [Nevskiaceae bacterium]|nr:pseudouridine synthase [Nevskiaceae bacterium]